MTHNFVATFRYQLPVDRLKGRARFLTRDWTISGIARASTGFPVTLAEHGDNSLEGSLPNGVNNHSLDLPDYLPGDLRLNHDPRNGQEYVNTSLFSTNALGTPGSASRRSFYGPGSLNFDLALLRNFPFAEGRTMQFRLE